MMNPSEIPKKIMLSDYRPPSFEVLSLNLDFEIEEMWTRVESSMKIKKKEESPLVLDGIGLSLESVILNDEELPKSHYKVSDESLTLFNVPNEFSLRISVKIKPHENTSLDGLYKSGNMYCTQCEAESFRKITYFLDRPDVMTSYTVTIRADAQKYPILLSNGDCVEKKSLPNRKHQCTWKDPFKKPTYLFALVAGDLGVLKDVYTTSSGKKVSLEIYTPHGLEERCRHAMESLKKSMKWEEIRFGLEYDLQTYSIVATDDFNMGAMENKGLNIFNSRLVYANPKTATDDDYDRIQSVIAHEYLHNWTGNRVTCRDWFQLSLKEGLTVFRDQEFSMDQTSKALVRIRNVNDLRSLQFPEDAGPNSHPIRPESCYAVDNFYTHTIYSKGAEVIRMMQTLVGRPGFRKGMELYFERHDGQAVTIDDFSNAISDANSKDWAQFKKWYSFSGTPHVQVTEHYFPETSTYLLTLKQTGKTVFHIPLVFGLIDEKGQELILKNQISTSSGMEINTEGKYLIHLTQEEQTIKFQNIINRPVLSINREFSSPIFIEEESDDQKLIHLMVYDSDAFNRWEAAQKIYQKELLRLIKEPQSDLKVRKDLLSAIGCILNDPLKRTVDPDLQSLMLTLPEESYLIQIAGFYNSELFTNARITLELAIAKEFESQFFSLYRSYHGKNVSSKDAHSVGLRRIKNRSLYYLSKLPNRPDVLSLIEHQFQNSSIMTDEIYALSILSNMDVPEREKAFEDFYQKWKEESVVLNAWFSVQASSIHPKTFEQVKKLWDHPAFNKKNPNRVYSLLRTFGRNISQFHSAQPSRYEKTYLFMLEKIKEIDQFNPQVASIITHCFDLWPQLPGNQGALIKNEISHLLELPLSKLTYETLSRCVS